MEKLGNKIFQLRKAKGLSQEELAEKLNVSRQSVSKWETDQSVPDSDNITAMCAFFNVSLDGFMGNVSEPPVAAVQEAAVTVAESPATMVQTDGKAENRQLWKKIVLTTFVWFFAALGCFTCISVAMISIIAGSSDPQYLTMVLPILCVSYTGLFAIVFTIVAVFYKKFKKPRV